MCSFRDRRASFVELQALVAPSWFAWPHGRANIHREIGQNTGKCHPPALLTLELAVLEGWLSLRSGPRSANPHRPPATLWSWCTVCIPNAIELVNSYNSRFKVCTAVPKLHHKHTPHQQRTKGRGFCLLFWTWLWEIHGDCRCYQTAFTCELDIALVLLPGFRLYESHKGEHEFFSTLLIIGYSINRLFRSGWRSMSLLSPTDWMTFWGLMLTSPLTTSKGHCTHAPTILLLIACPHGAKFFFFMSCGGLSKCQISQSTPSNLILTTSDTKWIFWWMSSLDIYRCMMQDPLLVLSMSTSWSNG